MGGNPERGGTPPWYRVRPQFYLYDSPSSTKDDGAIGLCSALTPLILSGKRMLPQRRLIRREESPLG
jgi:hypothetical protein